MRRRLFTLAAAVSAVLILAGCERFAHRYDYRGTLLRSDGTPAAGVEVSVLPWERFYFYGVEDGQPKRLDILDQWATVTDGRGRFAGHVNGGTTYLRWAFLPVAAAPELPEVFVWVRGPAGWSKTVVPLDAASQARGYPGGRHIDLRPVTQGMGVGEPPTPNDPAPAATTSEPPPTTAPSAAPKRKPPPGERAGDQRTNESAGFSD